MPADHDHREQRRLATAIGRLSAPQRAVLRLCAHESLGLAEAAAHLDIPLQKARTHLADALTALDRALERKSRPEWKRWYLPGDDLPRVPPRRRGKP